MIVSLSVCVIIPSIILGMLVSMRVVRLSEKNQYEAQINHLITAEKDLEGICTRAEQAAAILANESSVQAIIKKKASVMDYRYAADLMEENCKNIKCCSSIAVLCNGNVLFQRGERYLYEEAEFPHEKEAGSGKLSEWSPEQKIIFQHGISMNERKQIVYSTAVMEGINIIGSINIYLDVKEILKDIMPYWGTEDREQMVIHTAVITEDGAVLLQSSEEEIMTQYLDEMKNNNLKNTYGYFSTKVGKKECIVLHAKCGTTGWYLFQTEKRVTFYNMQIAFMGAVIFFCILFGVFYGMVQNKTIIQPLQHLSKRMDAVKNGVMEKKRYEIAHDEIGNVEDGFEDMVEELQKLINEVYIQTIKTKDAEREMLLAKMNPHFLYNSLDSIHWLAFRNKDYEVSEQLEALANVYRHILQFGIGKIYIEKEVEFIENYLFLLECQMGEKIEFVVDIPEEFYKYKIPKLIVQPLIENAVNHGLREKEDGGKVIIAMKKKKQDIIITVKDNGVGCDIKQLWEVIHDSKSNEAFALRNIGERLRLNSDEEDCMELYSSEEGGFTAILTVKVEECKNEIDGCR